MCVVYCCVLFGLWFVIVCYGVVVLCCDCCACVLLFLLMCCVLCLMCSLFVGLFALFFEKREACSRVVLVFESYCVSCFCVLCLHVL